MQVPVLIERIPNNGYRARTGEPLALTAEGATEEEVLKKLKLLVDDRLATGAQLIQLELAPPPHPLAKWTGTWQPGDPLIEEWKQAVEEYRQEIDEDPNR